MKPTLLTILLLTGCYQSHERDFLAPDENTGLGESAITFAGVAGQGAQATQGDSGTAISDHELPDSDSGAGVEADSDSGAAVQSRPTLALDEEPEPPAYVTPLLYQIVPNHGCTDAEQVLVLEGFGIEREATVLLMHHITGVTFAPTTLELGPSFLRFEIVPGPNLPEGNFLVWVRNLNALESNAVGIWFHDCEDE